MAREGVIIRKDVRPEAMLAEMTAKLPSYMAGQPVTRTAEEIILSIQENADNPPQLLRDHVEYGNLLRQDKPDKNSDEYIESLTHYKEAYRLYTDIGVRRDHAELDIEQTRSQGALLAAVDGHDNKATFDALLSLGNVGFEMQDFAQAEGYFRDALGAVDIHKYICYVAIKTGGFYDSKVCIKRRSMGSH